MCASGEDTILNNGLFFFSRPSAKAREWLRFWMSPVSALSSSAPALFLWQHTMLATVAVGEVQWERFMHGVVYNVHNSFDT